MHRCHHSFSKNPSNLWVVWVGYISFREISYAGKHQVVSSYNLSNLCYALKLTFEIYEKNKINLKEQLRLIPFTITHTRDVIE